MYNKKGLLVWLGGGYVLLFFKNSPALLVFSSFRTTGLCYPVFVCFLGRLLASGLVLSVTRFLTFILC